jgi:hypothetical protein
LCKCVCGNPHIAPTSDLRGGKTTRCTQCAHKATGNARRKILIGKKFGHLLVQNMIYGEKDNTGRQRTYCECLCDCGNTVKRLVDNLDENKIQSCGCAQKEINDKQSKNIIGQKFGRLTVLKEINDCSPRKVICLCECNNIDIYKKIDVMSGHTQSCGCLHKERTSTANEKDWTGYISDCGVKALKQMYKNNKGQWLWEYECPICKNKFIALPAKVASGHTTSCGCQIQSSGERVIKNILEKYNIEFIPQYTFEDCVYKNKLKFDFAIIKNGKVFCLIEYDGKQHFEPIEFFGGTESFIETLKRDKIKNNYCISNNIPLLRFKYTLTTEQIENKIIKKINNKYNLSVTTTGVA